MAVLLVGGGGILGAQERVAAMSGNAAAGERLAESCVACHGANGVGISGQFPNLAGQVPGYVAAQLALFQEGVRENAVMAPFVAGLSARDRADLDAYYSGLPGHKGAIGKAQEEAALAGGRIYRGGFREFEIPACMGCHGPSGHGIPPNFPRIAGQAAEYTEAQLRAFKSGARKSPIMNTIAFPLSEEQIKELALYISALY